MQNIKVNFTNVAGKKTSTTISHSIAWAYYEQSDTHKNDDRPYNDIHQKMTKEIQSFVNSIDLSQSTSVSPGEGITKAVIEDMLMNRILSHSYDKGYSSGYGSAMKACKPHVFRQ